MFWGIKKEIDQPFFLHGREKKEVSFGMEKR